MDNTNEAMQAAASSGPGLKIIFDFLLSKAGALAAGFVGAAAMVMALTHTNSKKEQFCAVFCTGIFSISGGSAFIEYYNLQAFGVAATLGIGMILGLPGWFIVRGLFTFFNGQKGKPITDSAKIIKDKVL